MAGDQQRETTQSTDQGSNNSGTLGGMTDKLSSVVSGGQGTGGDQSYLNKGIDAVQQSVFGQGDQSSAEKSTGMDQEKQNIHDAVDQAHPEKISEFMRDKYMSRTEEMNKEEGRS